MIKLGLLALAMAVALMTSQCTSAESPSDSTGPATTLAQGQSAIAGTLIATGGRAGTPDQPLTGQILIWPITDSTTTTGIAARPLQAIDTTGSYSASLDPGSYLVSATESSSGLSCGSTIVFVGAGDATTVDFICQHR